MFEKVENTKQLIIAFRPRYQMWVYENAGALWSFMNGFCAARRIDLSYLQTLANFAQSYLAEADGRPRGLIDCLERHALHSYSEIPLFFELFEKFENLIPIEHQECLVPDSQRAAMRNRGRVRDRAELYVEPPQHVRLVEFESWGFFLFYLDESRRRYYELSVGSLQRGEELLQSWNF